MICRKELRKSNTLPAAKSYPIEYFLWKWAVSNLTGIYTMLRDRREIPQVLFVFPSEKQLQTPSLPPFVVLK